MAAIAKTNRIDLRISDEDKAIIEQAADIKNISLSNYIISIVLKQAELDIEANEKIYLGKEDYEYVLDLIENPPEPTQALKELFNDN